MIPKSISYVYYQNKKLFNVLCTLTILICWVVGHIKDNPLLITSGFLFGGVYVARAYMDRIKILKYHYTFAALGFLLMTYSSGSIWGLLLGLITCGLTYIAYKKNKLPEVYLLVFELVAYFSNIYIILAK